MMELDYEGLRAATTRFQYILPGQYNHSLIASEIVRAYIKSAQSESDSYGNGYKIGFNDGLVSARDTQSEPMAWRWKMKDDPNEAWAWEYTSVKPNTARFDFQPLYAHPPLNEQSEPVKVKPLEWRKGYRDERVVITQASSSRLYQIRVLDGVVWLDWPDRREATTFSSEEAAQAAAQADYEQRIRSALVSHETPVGDSQTGSAGMGEWQIVPKEPTVEMLTAAGREALQFTNAKWDDAHVQADTHGLRSMTVDVSDRMYRAMLAVAPLPGGRDAG